MAEQFKQPSDFSCGIEKLKNKTVQLSKQELVEMSVGEIAQLFKERCAVSIKEGLVVHTIMHLRGVRTYADVAATLRNEAAIELSPRRRMHVVWDANERSARSVDWPAKRAARERRREMQELHEVDPVAAHAPFVRRREGLERRARDAAVLRKQERRKASAPVPRLVRQLRRDYGESYDAYAQWGIPIRVRIGPDEGTKTLIDRLCKSVTSAVLAITGGDGQIGKAIRRVLLAIVPAIVLMLAVKVFGKTVSAVIALLGSAAFAFLGPFKMMFDRVASQMGENGETALVSKVVAVAALAFFMKKKIPLVAMAGVVARLPSFQTATRNVMDWTVEAVQWMVNALRSMLGKEHITFWKRRSDQVTEWMDATMTLVKTPDGPQQDPCKVDELRTLGLDLARSFPDSVEIKRYNQVLEEMHVAIRPILKTMRLKRIEPLCVVLYGKSGIGKSLLVKRLGAAYMMKHYPELMEKTGRDPSPYMYAHDGGEFWNGFNEYHHKIMVLDDLGSRRTDDYGDSDIAKLIPIINTVQCPLNMPGMLDKGNTYFRSDYVIATSNKSRDVINDLAAKVINNPEAINRRMHLFIETTLKPEYVKNDRFDMEKANHPGARDPNGVWHFKVDVERTKQVLHFDSLIDLVKYINSLAMSREIAAANETCATDEFLDALGGSDAGEIVVAQGLMREPVVGFAGKTVVEVSAKEAVIREENGTTWIAFEGAANVFAEYGEVLSQQRKSWLGRGKEIWQWVNAWMAERTFVERFLVGFGVGVAVRLIGTMLVNFVKMFMPNGRNTVTPHGDLGSEDDSSLHSSYMSAISSNVYVATMLRPNKEPWGGISVLFVKGRLAIMPAHYLAIFRENLVRHPGSMLQFQNALGESFSMKLEDFGIGLDYVTKRDHGAPEDMIMVKLNSRREHRNIISRFKCNASWVGNREQVVWWRVKEKGTIENHQTRVENVTKFQYADSIVPEEGDMNKYLIAVGYKYSVDCKSGDCGALLVHDSHNKPDCIVGMHTAGAPNGVGYAVRVTREWLTHASDHFCVVEDRTLPAENVRQASEADLVTCQSMKELVVGVSCANVYSPLHAGNPMVASRVNEWSEFEGSGCDIELLRPSNTTMSATLAALEGHATEPELRASHPAFLAAARDLLDRVGFDARGKFELLSVAEAAEGTVHGVSFAPAINKRSSAGFPYQSKGYLPSQLFDRYGAVDLGSRTYRRYKEDCDITMHRALLGLPCRNVFAVCPKPETRPYHKTLPRIIQAANKPYTINWRRLFWPLTKFYSEWKPTNECAIGMNPFEHWDELAAWLLGHSGNIIAGDYSGFDKTHEPVITDALWQAISEKFDDDEYNRARSVLWRDANGAEVQLGRLVYKMPRGLPSGHPGTAVINSMYNCVLLTLAYTSILSGGTDEVPFGPGWEEVLPTFRHNVRLQVLGDDNIMSSTCDAFNELSIGPAMKRFGAKYTMDQKLNTAVAKFRRLHEVTFIGRGFRPTSRGFDPCLRMNSILDMGKWLQKRGDDTELWQLSVLEGILAELSLHDEDVWCKFAPVAVRAWELVGYRVPVMPVEATGACRLAWRERVAAVLGGYYE